MAVKIRLARIGKKNAPVYRIVAIDSRKKRNGEYLDDLGTYNPLTGQIVQLDKARVEEWLSKGAIPTETVERLYKNYKKSNA